MGKVSDADFAEMRDRLRARAVRLMTQLDGAAMYRAQIERDAARDDAGRAAARVACRVRHGQRRGRQVLQAVREGAGDGVRGREVPGAVCRVLGAVRCAARSRRRADARSAADARAGDSGRGAAGRQRHGSRRARDRWATTLRAWRWSSTARATSGVRRPARTAARSLRRCRRGLACTPAAVVDGERLESTTFDVPAAGGVRTILVAGLGLGTGGGAAGAGAPASQQCRPRAAVLRQQHAVCDRVPGRHHRGVLPARDRERARARRSAPASPLVITLPAEAVGARAARGRLAAGRRERAAGVDRRAVSDRRDLGARCVPRRDRGARVTSSRRRSRCRSIRSPLGVQRLSGLTVESAQASNVREASLSGQAFLIASGPEPARRHAVAIDAGGPAAQEPAAALHGARAGRDWWPVSACGWR